MCIAPVPLSHKNLWGQKLTDVLWIIGGLHHKKYTQYVYSHTSSDYRITHQYLCEKSDLEKPVYYYHDVGGYTRLDPDHTFTLHLGNHSGTPILGAMWHSSGGMQ
jgi:hypothetical protein